MLMVFFLILIMIPMILNKFCVHTAYGTINFFYTFLAKLFLNEVKCKHDLGRP